MRDDGFIKYLKRGGRTKSAVDRILKHVEAFQNYINTTADGKSTDQANLDDLLSYVEAIESEPSKSPKMHLWALIYYFEYLERTEMRTLAVELRQQRIKRKPFHLKDF